MESLPLIYGTVLALFLGGIVGSLLNVIVLRMPLEKSAFWPSSRCPNCLSPIRAVDKIPVIGFFITGRRCRNCAAPLSWRYPLVEVITALAFVAIFYLDVYANWHEFPYLQRTKFSLFGGRITWPHIGIWLHHALLFALLFAAALCDMKTQTIPLQLTVFGTLLGLVSAALHPWPWPNSPAESTPMLHPLMGSDANPWQGFAVTQQLGHGLYPWPVWGPLPSWLPAGSWQLGLVTGLVGALVGSLVVRALKFVAEFALGREALGLGDADLLMMAGAFVGWQPVVAALLLGGVASLVLEIPRRVINLAPDREFAFGPGLAIGVLVAVYGWNWIGPRFQLVFFDGWIMFWFVAVGGVVAYLLLLVMGWLRKRLGG